MFTIYPPPPPLPSFLSSINVFLLILSGLFDHINLPYIFFPVQMTFVLSVFILIPEKDPNSAKVLRVAVKGAVNHPRKV